VNGKRTFMKTQREVVIVGGGLSGLTAAYTLLKQAKAAKRPLDVTILEAEDRPGGQARAFKMDGVTVEHGSHVFFNYYKNIIQLIDELREDPALAKTMPSLSEVEGWTIVDPWGQRATMKQSPNLPTLIATLPSILTIPWLSLWERIKLAWGALQIIQTPYAEFKELDKKTAYELATGAGYSDIGAKTWNSASLGLTNLFVQEQSGAIFAGKHHLLINTPNGLNYKLPAGDLSQLVAEPLARKIAQMGGKILFNAEVQPIPRKGGDEARTVVTYKTAGGEAKDLTATDVILSVPPWVAHKLVPWVDAAWQDLGPVSRVATMVLKLSGLLQQSADERELGCSREQWAFSVITDLSHFWPEFEGDKTVLRVEIGHGDRFTDDVYNSDDELQRMVKLDIDRLYPAAADLSVEWVKVHREDKRLYTKWVKGQFAKKPDPDQRAVGQNVFLAGDWTSKGTIGMEAAVNSGIEAANHVLAAAGLPLAPFTDVPIE
jgi:protoporphyrinogen oxidase